MASGEPVGDKTAVKWLLILVLPLALAGCVTEAQHPLPMSLGPADRPAKQATCLSYSDAPAYGDCKTGNGISLK